MKPFIVILLILATTFIGATSQNITLLPMVFYKPPEAPTPTPLPLMAYNWVYVGVAFSYEPPETLLVYGHKPGFCYEVLYKKDGSDVHLWSQPDPECDPNEWHGQDWPPPEFPPPPSLPPEFDYGEIFKIEIPVRDLDFLRACSQLNGCVRAIQVEPP